MEVCVTFQGYATPCSPQRLQTPSFLSHVLNVILLSPVLRTSWQWRTLWFWCSLVTASQPAQPWAGSTGPTRGHQNFMPPTWSLFLTVSTALSGSPCVCVPVSWCLLHDPKTVLGDGKSFCNHAIFHPGGTGLLVQPDWELITELQKNQSQSIRKESIDLLLANAKLLPFWGAILLLHLHSTHFHFHLHRVCVWGQRVTTNRDKR